MSKPSRRQTLGTIASVLCATVPLPAFAASKTVAQPYSWTSVPYGGGGYVDGLLYHPTEKGLLYARTDVGGMYRYDYAGKRWLPLLDHLARGDADLMGVLSMAVDRQDSNRVYAACGLYLPDWARTGAILRSLDRGQTWKKTELPIRIGGNADGRGTGDRLMVDPHDSNTVYFASNQDGLWKSTDAGETFSKSSQAPSKALSLIIFDPKTGDMYVGSAEGKGGLFISRDKGLTFEKVDGTPDQVPQHAVFTADGTFYVTFAQGDNALPANPSFAVRGGVWKREVGSDRWRNVSPIKTDEHNLFGYSGIDVSPDGLLVVSTLDRWWPNDDLFASRDGGTHWVPLSQQTAFNASAYPWLAETNKEWKMGGWLSDLRINPFNADEMVYGHGGGLWMSRNLSVAGTKETLVFDANMDNLEEGAVTQLVSPNGGATLLAAELDTAGASWDDISKPPNIGLFRPNTESNYSIDYAGLKTEFLVRTVGNTGTRGYYSTDSGASWDLFAASPYKPPTEGGDWRNPGTIVVSSKASALVWVPEKEPASYSLDNGKTWATSSGWPTSSDQALIPISDKIADRVFYAHDRAGGRILISVDGGASFQAIANGITQIAPWDRAQLGVVPTRMRDLWLALPSMLLHSREAGAPFGAIKNVEAAWAIGFGAAASKDGYPAVFLFGRVKGTEGLWRSDDEGANWARINDDAHQFGDMHSISGDPLEFGTIYIAPHGRGIMVGRPKN